jgi:hypothetical protein
VPDRGATARWQAAAVTPTEAPIRVAPLAPLLTLLACAGGTTDTDTDTDPAPRACDLYGLVAGAAAGVPCDAVAAPYDPPPTPRTANGHLALRFAPPCPDGAADCPDDARARCVDGTRPAYHVDPAECLTDGTCGDAPNRWTFFFQGGGSCFDLASCLRAYTDPAEAAEMSTAHQTVDRAVPTRTPGDGILSERADNAFRDTHRVQLYKCSYDRFIGDATTVVDGEDGQPVALHFHGRRMIRAVLADLARASGTIEVEGVALPDLADAEVVLLTGNSGGAGGLIHNLDEVAGLVRDRAPGARVVGVLDARFEASAENEASFETTGPCAGGACDAYRFDAAGTTEAPADRPGDPPVTLTRDRSTFEPGGPVRSGLSAWLPPAADAFEASCASAHADDPTPCFDEGHLLLNHVTTPIFLHQALFDGNHLRGPVEWVRSPDPFVWQDHAFARAGRLVRQADTLLERRANADGAATAAAGIFLPGHQRHVSLVDDAHFLDGALCRGCGGAEPTCVSYHDALVAFVRDPADAAWVEDRPERRDGTRPPLSHAMSDGAANGWRWRAKGRCP